MFATFAYNAYYMTKNAAESKAEKAASQKR